MAGSLRFVDLVQDRIGRFLDDRAAHLAAIAPELADFPDVSREFLTGGKRFRALFAYWGWHAVSALDPDGADGDAGDPMTALEPVVTAASALELFHAAALVHDDIMDNSDLRRGRPAVHRIFQARHGERGQSGDAAHYGVSSALLLGDLLLGWSDELLDAGLAALDHPDAARAARAEFTTMRTEVTAGQYLDILEESSWRLHPDDEQLDRAHRVVLYKSAKYSVEAPLSLGATIAGANAEQIDSLRAFGVPLGVAFQLRDDLLGVFGDPEVTGKPAGDDLREGKRTVLVALARHRLPASAARLVDELLGDPDLEDSQIRMLQTTIRDSGAVDQTERIIARNVDRALAALEPAPLGRDARDELARLAHAVTRRES